MILHFIYLLIVKTGSFPNMLTHYKTKTLWEQRPPLKLYSYNLTLHVNLLSMSCNRCTAKCDVCGERHDVRDAAYFHLLHGVCHCCVLAVVLTHLLMEQFECDNMNDPIMSHDSCFRWGGGGCQTLGNHCCSCSANWSRAAQSLRYLDT